MPPSCPHAVFTPDDCLAVGGHFYTAAHLGSTLRGLKLQEDYPAISNEDLHADFYNLLHRVFENAHTMNIPLQQADILSASSLFLDSLDPTSLSILLRTNRRGGSQLSRALKQLESSLRINSHLAADRSLFLSALEHLRKRIVEDLEAE